MVSQFFEYKLATAYQAFNPGFFKDRITTISLIAINVVVFFSYFRGDITVLKLLDLGGNFAPYTLDQDFYRLFSSMFLHGNLWHIVLNSYSLYILGITLEPEIGSLKTLEIYLISGLLAGLSSLYFNLFTVSVGASGAIFGLYGYTLVREYTQNRNAGRFALLANFILYMVIMLAVGKKWGFDNAGHIGGLVGGVLLAVLDKGPVYKRYFGMTALMWPVLALTYFLLPRYQVSYFKAYQFFSDIDKTIGRELSSTKSDNDTLDKIAQLYPKLDSVLYHFKIIPGVPKKLQRDVELIEEYITLKKRLFNYYKLGINRESYIFTDSIRYTNYLISQLPGTSYKLYMGESDEPPSPPENTAEELPLRREAYDEDWFPTNDYDAAYYRLGYQDSLREWHGMVEDYYRNGAIQMKGTYKRGLKDGIFLYYNKDSTYTSAGRYENDNYIGKWEIFYTDNRLNYEMRYQDGRSYMLNFYDSLGNQLIRDGEGEEIYYHPNGMVSYVSQVEKGRRNGWIKGFDEFGKLLYQEWFEDGYFIRGISYDDKGSLYKYDNTAYQPFPKGGFEAFHQYLEANAISKDSVRGRVRLRFTVHQNGHLSNIRFMERLGEPYDSDAKKLLLDGPPWVSGRLHGYKPYTTDTEIIVNY